MLRLKYAIAAGALLSSTIALAETMHGDAGANRILGSGVGDTIYGYAGDDQLNGLGGNDHLYGGPGRDLLRDNVGTNRMVGGPDLDTFYLENATYTTIDDYEGGEVVYVSCATSWGSGANYNALISQNSKTPNADMVFTGRDGKKVLFKGFSHNDWALSNGALFPPTILESGPC